MRFLAVGLAAVTILATPAGAGAFEADIFSTSGGELKVTFIGHGTLMFEFGGKVIHVDPWSKLADYSTLPKADLILLTHHHRDHLDPQAIALVRTEKTQVILTESCTSQVQGGTVMRNGDKLTLAGLAIEAIPAYNLVNMRSPGIPFHPPGEGNGYVIRFADHRVYVAGDTENTPEMKSLTNIQIAFLPMNLPYTMTPEMVADAARAFKPAILYPYHYGETDPLKLTQLLKGLGGVEVRIRPLR